MKATPLISLGASVILGAAAILLGRGYMTENKADAMATNYDMPVIEMGSVLVAADTIAMGDPVAGEAVRVAQWPVDAIPQGVVTSVDMLQGEAFARTLIVKGEPIFMEKVIDQQWRQTLSASIKTGMRAVSIEVSSTTGVAGFVLPGDRVDVNEFVELEPREPERRSPEDMIAREGDIVARPVLKNVLVLAADQNFAPDMEGASLSNTVTLEVTPESALVLGAAGQRSRLGLTLIGREEETVSVAEVIAPKPKAAPRPRRVVRVTTPKQATVRVINGTHETTVTTPVARPSAPVASDKGAK